MPTIDLAKDDLRALNPQLQTAARAAAEAQSNETQWRIDNPRGSHAIAVGLDGPIAVTVGGSTGYYCAGMNKEASITVEGSAGPGVAENMMSGTVVWADAELPARAAAAPARLDPWGMKRSPGG